MRIDLPCCNLKTCRYCFDGNCTDEIKYEQCEYTNAKEMVEMMICKKDKCYLCKWRYEQGEHCENCCRNYDDNFEEDKDGKENG